MKELRAGVTVYFYLVHLHKLYTGLVTAVVGDRVMVISSGGGTCTLEEKSISRNLDQAIKQAVIEERAKGYKISAISIRRSLMQ